MKPLPEKFVRALKVPVFVVCLTPAFVLTWKGFHNALGANPIDVITRSTGTWTLTFLLITLSVTPVRKLSGLTKYGNITLKWGANGTALFWNWILSAMQGQVQRANGSIKLLDENRAEVMRWNFTRAWPTKYTGPSFGAAKNEIAMQTLVLAIESLRIDT